MIRDRVKSAAANFFCVTGIDRMFRPRNLPVVVAYHRVVADFASSAETSNPSMLVSRQMLEKHLDWIGRRYRFVDLDELGSRLESGDLSNSRIAAITFDDGYQDFYDHALPVLQRKGIPAAVFVVTGYVGTRQVQVHDKLYLLLKRLHGRLLHADDGASVPDISAMTPYRAMRTLLEALPLEKLQGVIRALEAECPLPEELLAPFQSLSWETLDRIHRSGVTVGSHTRTHVLMTNETSRRVSEEVVSSREEIKSRLPGCAAEHFAYPSGLFDTASVNAIASAGYRFGYTTCSHRSAEYPALTIPRTVLWENSSLDSHRSFSGAVLDCQIQHAFAWVGGCRQGHQLGQESGR